MNRRAQKSNGKQVRTYTQPTVKLLWGRAAGRCAVAECRTNLIADETDYDPAVPIGDIAHIEAASNQGPRANSVLTVGEKNDYPNLILLCKHCHSRFDMQKNYHSVEYIRQIKRSHEDWVKASLPERGRSNTGWRVIRLKGQHPPDSRTFDAALCPDYISGVPLEIEAVGANPWAQTADRMRISIENLFSSQDSYESRFAVFPLAPVTACIYLGYLLSNRPTVRLFQYHRDAQSWVWPDPTGTRTGISVEIVKDVPAPTDIAFLFELSARMDRTQLVCRLPTATRVLSIGVPDPATRWLQDPRQIQTLGMVARELFEDCINFWPGAQKWHLFYAGPAPGGVIVGQQLNPTMTPPFQLYEFIHPHHSESLRIEPTLLKVPTV